MNIQLLLESRNLLEPSQFKVGHTEGRNLGKDRESISVGTVRNGTDELGRHSAKIVLRIPGHTIDDQVNVVAHGERLRYFRSGDDRFP